LAALHAGAALAALHPRRSALAALHARSALHARRSATEAVLASAVIAVVTNCDASEKDDDCGDHAAADVGVLLLLFVVKSRRARRGRRSCGGWLRRHDCWLGRRVGRRGSGWLLGGWLSVYGRVFRQVRFVHERRIGEPAKNLARTT
jgi:hypothetical protein